MQSLPEVPATPPVASGRRGHRYGVVGSNGSGKTTLMARREPTELSRLELRTQASVLGPRLATNKSFVCAFGLRLVSRLASKDLMGLPEVGRSRSVLQRSGDARSGV